MNLFHLINRFFYLNFPKQYGKFQYIKNISFLPFKLLLVKSKYDASFSSKDQDFWVIEEIFKRKKNGYFVDLAATSGVLENNTFLLERLYGWDGICIEPNPNFFNRLLNNRCCFKENSVVTSDDNEKVEFVFNGGTGGIIGENYDNKLSKRSALISKLKKNKRVAKLSSLSLKTILDKYNAPKIIDYLSLDVEGAEYDVFKNFPFNKYKFLSMTIERPPKKLNDLLFANGYIFVKNHKVDTFYIHSDIKDSLDPSIFTPFIQLEQKKW